MMKIYGHDPVTNISSGPIFAPHLADTTIYDMEQRDEFAQRFHPTARRVVWDLVEVEACLDAREPEPSGARAGKASAFLIINQTRSAKIAPNQAKSALLTFALVE